MLSIGAFLEQRFADSVPRDGLVVIPVKLPVDDVDAGVVGRGATDRLEPLHSADALDDAVVMGGTIWPPSPQYTLYPLYSLGLWLAVTTMPA